MVFARIIPRWQCPSAGRAFATTVTVEDLQFKAPPALANVSVFAGFMGRRHCYFGLFFILSGHIEPKARAEDIVWCSNPT